MNLTLMSKQENYKWYMKYEVKFAYTEYAIHTISVYTPWFLGHVPIVGEWPYHI